MSTPTEFVHVPQPGMLNTSKSAEPASDDTRPPTQTAPTEGVASHDEPGNGELDAYDFDPAERLARGKVDTALDALITNMHRCALEMEALKASLASTALEVRTLADSVQQATNDVSELGSELERAKGRR